MQPHSKHASGALVASNKIRRGGASMRWGGKRAHLHSLQHFVLRCWYCNIQKVYSVASGVNALPPQGDIMIDKAVSVYKGSRAVST